MKKFLILVVGMATLLALVVPGLCARLFPGYGGTRWGASFHAVSKTFRNGIPGRIGEQVIYKQVEPDRIISQRTFGFKNNGLSAVSVTFNPAYVKKTGVETLLNRFVTIYGEPSPESSAPHLVSYHWEDSSTRITFAYTANSADMTVLVFQQRDNN